jgi:glycosyltransferase involved in cell wall biosynthesis
LETDRETLGIDRRIGAVAASGPIAESYPLTVVIPLFNKETEVKRTLDSVFSQTCDPQRFEVIVVDDCSSDSSAYLAARYLKRFPNYRLVYLAKNSGTPSIPRNVGMKLARGEYIFLIDADDWIAPDSIETLLGVAEESGDDYVVGRTVAIGNNPVERITAQTESALERRGVTLEQMDDPFCQLAPRSRIFRRSVAIDNCLRFPNLRYSEDSWFFFDVLTHISTMATTTKRVCYLNRMQAKKSLSQQSSIFEKLETKLLTMQHVMESDASEYAKRQMMIRLIEFDCITRVYKRYSFLKRKDKSKYWPYLDRLIAIIDLYDSEHDALEPDFRHDFSREVIELGRRGEYDKIAALSHWYLEEPKEDFTISGGRVYENTGIEGVAPLLVRLRVYADRLALGPSEAVLTLRCYGDRDEVRWLQVRSEADLDAEANFPVEYLDSTNATVTIPYAQLSALPEGPCTVEMIFSAFHRAHLRTDELEGELGRGFSVVDGHLAYRA